MWYFLFIPKELVTFRELHEDDLPGVNLLIERADAQRDGLLLPSVLSDLEMVNKIQKKMLRPGAWADVAVLDDNLAGICLGYPVTEARDLPSEYADGEYISLLMVEPEYWGRRIASNLLDRTAERTRQRGKRQLLLLTKRDDNSHARAIYEHKGFTLTGDTRLSKYGQQVLYLINL